MKTILVIIAYVSWVPIVWLIAKSAQGILGKFTGVMNNTSKGLFDRNKNFRANSQKSAHERALAGQRFQGDSKLSVGASSLIKRGYDVRHGRFSLNPGTRTDRRNAAVAGGTFTDANKVLKDPGVKASPWWQNDEMLESVFAKDDKGNWGEKKTISAHLTASRLKQKGAPLTDVEKQTIDEETEMVLGGMRDSGVSKQAFGMAAVMQNATTGTGFAGGAKEMNDAIKLVTGGQRDLVGSVVGQMRSMGGNARRPDLFGPGFGDTLGAYKEQIDGIEMAEEKFKGVQQQYNSGALGTGATATAALNNARVTRDTEISAAREGANTKMTSKALEAQGAYGLVTARPAYLRVVAQQQAAEFDEAMRTGSTDGAITAASKIAALRQQLSSAPPENRKILTDLFEHVGIDLSDVHSADEQLGSIIGTHVKTQGRPIDQIQQEIRTRGGFYDSGTRGLQGMLPGGPPGSTGAPVAPPTPIWTSPPVTPPTPPPSPTTSPWPAPPIARTPPPPSPITPPSTWPPPKP